MSRFFTGLLALSLIGVAVGEARSQNTIKPVPLQRPAPQGVQCKPIPNGEAQTIVCDNGYWITTMPDGSVHHGNGVIDPNARLHGSRINNDPVTGQPRGVIPPDQSASPGPGQWWYGSPIPSN